MISRQDVSIIAEIATRYGVKRVLVFGSSTEPNREARDIDLAAEGVQPHDFSGS